MGEDKDSIPRRKALLTTAGLGSTLIGVPSVVVADKDTERTRKQSPPSHQHNDQYQSVQEILEEEWTDENGEIKIPNSELEQWEVTTVDSETKKKKEDIRIYVGESKNATPMSNQRNGINRSNHTSVHTASWSNLTYVKLGGKEAFGYEVSLGAGLRINPTAAEASIDFSIYIGNTEITLWGVGISHGEKDGICTDVSPGQFPLEIEGCLDVQWAGGNEISIGGSVDVCTSNITELCPGWIDCQQCVGGIGGSRTIEIDDYM